MGTGGARGKREGMSAKDASKQLGLGFVGALLAGGLLLAVCAAPGGRPAAREPLKDCPACAGDGSAVGPDRIEPLVEPLVEPLGDEPDG